MKTFIKMKEIRDIRIKGSSIAEVLIALVISTACVYLASVIYIGVLGSSRNIHRLKCMELCQKYLEETRISGRYWDESFQASGFRIRKIIERHSNFRDCISIRIVVFDTSKKKLGELESVVAEIK